MTILSLLTAAAAKPSHPTLNASRHCHRQPGSLLGLSGQAWLGTDSFCRQVAPTPPCASARIFHATARVLERQLRRTVAAVLVTAALASASHSARASVYSIDDGAAENAIDINNGGTLIAINQFTLSPGSATITSISAAFGLPGRNDSSLLGESFTVMLYSDPRGMGNPALANLLVTATGTVTSIDSNTFITVPITPTTITGTDFFVGCSVRNTAGTFTSALDQSTDVHQSFVAGDYGTDPVDLANLSHNDIAVSSLDSVGFPGNWLLRANAVPEPATWAMLSLGAVGAGVMLRRRSVA